MKSQALKKDTVTSKEVQSLLAMKETQAALRQRLDLMDDAIKSAEADLIAKLDHGADFSTCGFGLSIRETEKRFPAWKEHFIQAAGKDAADKVLADTEAKTYRTLVVK